MPVVGGYVGANLQGVTTTLGKEGSGLLRRHRRRRPGVPRRCRSGRTSTACGPPIPVSIPEPGGVRTLSFAEALELSCSGSKKPHYGTLGPASRANVPIRIQDSRHPESEGTIIGRRNPAAPPVVKSVALPVQRASHLRAHHGYGGGAKGWRRAWRRSASVSGRRSWCWTPTASWLSIRTTGSRTSTRRCSRRWESPPSLDQPRPVRRVPGLGGFRHLAGAGERALAAGRDFEPRWCFKVSPLPRSACWPTRRICRRWWRPSTRSYLPGGIDEVVE